MGGEDGLRASFMHPWTGPSTAPCHDTINPVPASLCLTPVPPQPHTPRHLTPPPPIHLTSPSAFGSACGVSDKFLKAVEKSGVVDNVVNWAKFKQ